MDSGEGWHPPLNKTCPVCGGEVKTKHYIEKDGHIRAQYEPIDHSKELAEALKTLEGVFLQGDYTEKEVLNIIRKALTNYRKRRAGN